MKSQAQAQPIEASPARVPFPGRLISMSLTVLMSVAVLAVFAVAAQAAPSRSFLPELSHSGINKPQGLAVDSEGNLYVAESKSPGGQQVFVYAPNGSLITKFTTPSPPTSLAVDSVGNVYVVALFSSTVFKYKPSSYPPTGSTTYGPDTSINGTGEVTDRAHSIDVDPVTDNLYVSEGQQCCNTEEDHRFRIASFKPDGTLITNSIGEFMGGGGSPPNPNGDAVYMGVGIYGANGNVYALDQENHKVYIFNPAGTEVLVTIDGSDSEAGEFTDLEHSEIAVDQSNGHVLIGDMVTHKVIVEYDAEGHFVYQLPKKFESHEIKNADPTAIAVDNSGGPTDGNVYVSSNDGNVFAFGPLAEPAIDPPAIEAQSVSGISSTEAVLGAKVNPKGTASSAHFEYGTTESYGHSVPVPDAGIGSAVGGVTISQPIAALQPATTYHYRVVATNVHGISEGEDRIFTTRALPSAGLPDNRAYEMVSPPEKNGADILEDETAMAAEDGGAVTFASLGAFADTPSAPVLVYYRAQRGGEAWSTRGISPPVAQNGNQTLAGVPLIFSADLNRSVWSAFPAPPMLPGEQADAFDFYRHEAPGGPWQNLTPVAPDPGSFGLGRSARFFWANDSMNAIGINTLQSLTPDAPNGMENAYVWSAEDQELHFVGIAPDGSPMTVSTLVGEYSWIKNSISADGSQVIVTTNGNIYLRQNPSQPQSPLDSEGHCSVPTDACTVEASASKRTVPTAPLGATFEGASVSGDKVLFRTSEQLIDADEDTSMDMYIYEPPSDTLRRISVDQNSADGTGAGVQDVFGAGEEVGKVYFAASGLLVPGQPSPPGTHVYAWHDDGTPSGSLSYITTLDGALDAPVWESIIEGTKARLVQVSPNGRYLLFTAKTKLGGYENAGHSELYRFDSETGQLDCVSCDPSGEAASADASMHEADSSLAGILDFHSRNVLDDGSVFFDTADALSSRDSNGKTDVYEWKDGNLALISTGSGDAPSRFANASADGDDVFFYTRDRLTGWDVDENVDLYDARVDGGLPEPPSPAPSCQGDACQPPPRTLDDPTPASSSFSGPGDPGPSKKARCPKGKRRVNGRGGRTRCVKRQARKHKRVNADRRTSR